MSDGPHPKHGLARAGALVSFCNLSSPDRAALAQVDFVSEQVRPIRLGAFEASQGCTGLTADTEIVYALFLREGNSYIAALRRADLQPAFCQPLVEVKDGHSILASNGGLYVVSTGSDEVLRYSVTPHGVADPQVVWRATDQGMDTHHVSSIVAWGDRLIASAFGPKSGPLWSSASKGYLHDVNRDLRIREGIYHPHSLSVHHEELYYCESQTKSFCSLEEGPLLQLEGYTRGVCWLSDGVVAVACSVGRRVSESTRLVANPADPGETFGACKIFVVQSRTQTILKQIDLGGLGTEIYDLLLTVPEPRDA